MQNPASIAVELGRSLECRTMACTLNMSVFKPKFWNHPIWLFFQSDRLAYAYIVIENKMKFIKFAM